MQRGRLGLLQEVHLGRGLREPDGPAAVTPSLRLMWRRRSAPRLREGLADGGAEGDSRYVLHHEDGGKTRGQTTKGRNHPHGIRLADLGIGIHNQCRVFLAGRCYRRIAN